VPTAFDGYRIVHISDLHLDGWRGQAGKLQRAIERINDLHPDLIVFTGDLVSFDFHEL
jgi:predicted MPP superfamily phosphohydrolase